MIKKYKLHYRKLEWEGSLPHILKVIRTELIPNVRKFNPLQIVITEIKPEEKPEPKARFQRCPTPFMPPTRLNLFEGLMGSTRTARRKRYLKRASLKELKDEIKSRKKLKKKIKKVKRKRR